MHGRVVCLEVIGKEAWIGVVLEKSTFPFVEEEGFRVVDRGEGVNDDPDQFSGGGLPGGTTYCAQKPLTPLRDLEAGNIQVRG